MERKPFHRSDFTGSEGPGMAKLRAAREAGKTFVLDARGNRKMVPGISALREMMGAGKWQDAILCAAKWHDLGDEAAAIHRGREAIMRPAFQRQLKRDPARMIEEAKAALVRRYGNV